MSNIFIISLFITDPHFRSFRKRLKFSPPPLPQTHTLSPHTHFLSHTHTFSLSFSLSLTHTLCLFAFPFACSVTIISKRSHALFILHIQLPYLSKKGICQLMVSWKQKYFSTSRSYLTSPQSARHSFYILYLDAFLFLIFHFFILSPTYNVSKFSQGPRTSTHHFLLSSIKDAYTLSHSFTHTQAQKEREKARFLFYDTLESGEWWRERKNSIPALLLC